MISTTSLFIASRGKMSHLIDTNNNSDMRKKKERKDVMKFINESVFECNR